MDRSQTKVRDNAGGSGTVTEASGVREAEKRPADAKSGGAAGLAKRAEPLDPKRHASLRILQGRDFSYAAGMHTVPLSVVEFMPSARHYPIIFAGSREIQPVAMVGLRPGENLFVAEDGGWKEGCYIPAILRRAPFVLLQDSKKGQDGVMLCLDVESPLISKTEGSPLFQDGKPTPLIAKMGSFAAAYSKEQARTRAFVNACIERDLLAERQMEITLANGQKLLFAGFKVIDEEKLRKLPDSDALLFYRRGWLALADAHFLSLGNMGRLHHRANFRAKSIADNGALDFTGLGGKA
ncbi:SapC family protein [Rhodospirillaceae bacterium KN72]|uniref:SapC family protein n=1 Tax=Pacificispira spongiicola TaxID=2729598 RepID=A0A7Y0HG40_9PROT|nr:SapC family protein [Pacificispira spongiicola]NMM43959.1 SapC family protein [Pacificispira spongiicola]